MKRKMKLWIGITGFVAVLAGCHATAHIEKDDNANFSHYKTFAWVNEESNRKHSNDMTETRIKEAVNKELEKSSGWREVKSNPDILLNYDVLVERSTRETNSPVYSSPFTRMIFNPYTRRYSTIYYPSQFVGYEKDQRPIREGTVTITMIDTRTDKPVWQGWTTDEVNSRNLTAKEVQASVKSIFRKFDVVKN